MRLCYVPIYMIKNYTNKLLISISIFLVSLGGVAVFVLKQGGSIQSPTTPSTPTGTTSGNTNTPSPTSSNLRVRNSGEGGEGESEDDYYPNGGTNQSSPAQTPTPVTATPATVPSSTKSKYKNGTYSAVGVYYSPEGQESINVSVTLTNGIVTDSTVTGNATNGRSVRYQQMFIGGFKSLVIGKSIDAISLDYVSGSSLTPAGFNDALSQIKTKAQA